jgi:hypothetical protein
MLAGSYAGPRFRLSILELQEQNNQGLAYRYVIVAQCIEVAKTQSASRMGYSEPKRHLE